MNNQPLVSIVTPSLNMGRFLGEAIRSVLDQDYANIEYIVVDGGSTDETLDILESHSARLRYATGKDRGPADAINRGFALANGEILAYLAADDSYLPGAVATAVRFLKQHPEHAGVYGEAWWVDESGQIISRYPTADFDAGELARKCYICQPACFVRRSAVESVGGLDPNLDFVYDYELWIRMAASYTFGRVPEVLARSRMHANNRTLSQRGRAFEETMHVLHQRFGYVPFDLVYTYCAYSIDGRDQFYQPLIPSLAKYVASLATGLAWNWRHPARYLADWAGVMSFRGALRRMRFAPSVNPDPLRWERAPEQRFSASTKDVG